MKTLREAKPDTRWNRFSVARRKRLLISADPTMSDPAYSALVDRMANSEFSELSGIQKEGVAFLLGF